MEKWAGRLAFWASCTILCLCVQLSFAQTPSVTPAPVSLTVQAGTPLHIELTKKVPVKHAGVPVEGKLMENVYVFDHLVIPKGSLVLGKVASVESASKKTEALAVANGNFTPMRTAHVDFNTLVEPDGKRFALTTTVLQGAPNIIHITAGESANKKKKGRVSAEVDQIHQQVKNQEDAAIDNVTAPGKMQRIKSALSARLPYHRPMLPVGTSFTAELKAPLAFGDETPTAQQLEKMGGPIPPGSLVHIRLVTALSSATDHRDSPVRAVISQPLYSADHALILPEGAQLTGTVSEAVPARLFSRNGQLRFTFHQLEVSTKAVRNVEASLQGVDAASGGRLQLDAEGGAHAVTPKTDYVMPAIDIFLASTSLDLDGERHALNAGHVGDGADYGGAAVRGGAAFGFAGSIISLLAHSRVVSSGFAFYGAGWAVYSHFMARGADVTFPKNTPMEIRFGTHEAPPPPAASKPIVSAVSASGKTT